MTDSQSCGNHLIFISAMNGNQLSLMLTSIVISLHAQVPACTSLRIRICSSSFERPVLDHLPFFQAMHHGLMGRTFVCTSQRPVTPVFRRSNCYDMHVYVYKERSYYVRPECTSTTSIRRFMSLLELIKVALFAS